MKKSVFFLALLVILVSSCSKQERNEKKFLKAMMSEDFEEAAKGFDEFCTWLERDKSTMTYDFNLMREKMALKVVSSADGKVRCYSWPTLSDGNVVRYANVEQWLVNDMLVASREPLDRLFTGKNAMPHSVDTIMDIQGVYEKPVYLIVQSFMNSSGNMRSFITAAQITDNYLLAIPFFFDGMNNAGNHEYESGTNVKTSDMYKWDEKTRRLQVFETDDSLHIIPGKYTVYQLGNKQFTRVESAE